MNIPDEFPILVGCGQLTQRAEDPLAAQEPLDLMEQALRRADDDGRRAMTTTNDVDLMEAMERD